MVYKIKLVIFGVEETKFKARVVAKVSSQVEGIDYHEISSPIVKHTSIILMLSILVLFDLELEHDYYISAWKFRRKNICGAI